MVNLRNLNIQWFQKRHKMWVETIYPWKVDVDERQMKKISEEFLTLLLEIYGKCIINDMFSIIIGKFAEFKL